MSMPQWCEWLIYLTRGRFWWCPLAMLWVELKLVKPMPHNPPFLICSEARFKFWHIRPRGQWADNRKYEMKEAWGARNPRPWVCWTVEDPVTRRWFSGRWRSRKRRWVLIRQYNALEKTQGRVHGVSRTWGVNTRSTMLWFFGIVHQQGMVLPIHWRRVAFEHLEFHGAISISSDV